MTVPISSKELELIHKLRKRVTDVVPEDRLTDDYFLCRWIRARDGNLEKAEAMLRKSMGWCTRNELFSITEWKPPHDYACYALLGHDDCGCPGKLNFERFRFSSITEASCILISLHLL